MFNGVIPTEMPVCSTAPTLIPTLTLGSPQFSNLPPVRDCMPGRHKPGMSGVCQVCGLVGLSPYNIAWLPEPNDNLEEILVNFTPTCAEDAHKFGIAHACGICGLVEERSPTVETLPVRWLYSLRLSISPLPVLPSPSPNPQTPAGSWSSLRPSLPSLIVAHACEP